jgi:hypothetical protein
MIFRSRVAKMKLMVCGYAPYRPINLQTHIDFKQYFGPAAAGATPAPNPQCVADDIEAKWQEAGYPGLV